MSNLIVQDLSETLSLLGERPAAGGRGASAFDGAVDFTLRHEGGYVKDDAGKGETNLGINKAANPDVDVKGLTPERARTLYRERYWNSIDGDKLAQVDPVLATVAFDTAVNMGPGAARKLLAASGGDASKLLDLRQRRYEELLAANPEKFGTYAGGWARRLDELRNLSVPAAEAQRSQSPMFLDYQPGAGQLPERNLFGAVNDTVIDTANAAAGLVKSGVDLVAPDSAVSKGIEGFIRSGEASQSDRKKAMNRQLQEELQAADGDEWKKAGIQLQHALTVDPLGTGGQIIGNVGVFAGLGTSMKAMQLAQGIRSAVTVGLSAGLGAGEVRGNIWERVSSMSDKDLMQASPAYAELRKQGVSEDDAKRELGANISRNLPEVLGAAAVGALSGKFGPEALVTGAAPKLAGGRLGGAVLGFLDEGPLQGGVEQLASNYGVQRVIPSQSLTQDLGPNIVMEGLPGAAMGAAFNTGNAHVRQPAAAPAPSGPLGRAAEASNPTPPAGPAPAQAAADVDPISERAAQIADLVRQDNLLQALREIGNPQANTAGEFLDALAVAQNPTVDARRRQEALDSLEAALGWIKEGRMPGDAATGSPYRTDLTVPEAPQPGAVAPAGSPEFFDPNTVDAESTRVDNMLPGPKALPAPSNPDETASNPGETQRAALPNLQANPGETAAEVPVQRRTVEAPKVATPAGDGPAVKRNRKAQLAALVDDGFDTVERGQDGGFFLVNEKRGEQVRLDNAGDAQMARKAVADYVDTAAANVNREPTEAQKSAGNYAKGHLRINGFDVALENPRGGTRSGVSPDGRAWSSTMAHHYGYIKRTEGADGDAVDVFIGNRPDSDRIYVVDQVNPDGTFDEHKVLMGFTSEKDARAGYLANYEKGWQGLGAIHPMTVGQFRQWLSSGAKAPISSSIPVKETSNAADGQQQGRGVPAGADLGNRAQSAVPEGRLPDPVHAGQDQAGDAAGNAAAGPDADVAAAVAKVAQDSGTPDLRVAADTPEARGLRALLKAVSDVFGVRAEAVESQSGTSFDGAYQGGIVLVSTSNPHQHVAQTIGHEFAHSKEDLVQPLRSAIWGLINEAGRQHYFEKYLFKPLRDAEGNVIREGVRYRDATPEQLEQLKAEMLADFFGQRFKDRDWLDQLAQREPSLFGQFVKTWISLLNAIEQGLRALAGRAGPGSIKNVDKYLDDLQLAKRLALEAAVAWAQKGRVAAGKGEAVQFSSKDLDEGLRELGNFNVDAKLDMPFDGELSDEDMDALQAELDAQFNPPVAIKPQKSPLEVTDAEIKRAGLMAEDAYPDLAWDEEDGQFKTKVPDLYVKGKAATIYLEPPQDNGLYRVDGMRGTWVGPAGNEAGAYVTEAMGKAFVRRQVAARDLAEREFDLLTTTPAAKRRAAVQAWKAMAGAENAARLLRNTAKDKAITAIAASMGITDQFEVAADSEEVGPRERFVMLQFKDKKTGAKKAAEFDLAERDGKKYIVVHSTELGKGGMGAVVYQLIAEYAARIGATIKPDSSLSGINTYRRTEQMLSAALRTGRSNVMTPHLVQRVYGFNEEADSAKEHEDNIARLLLATLRNARELAPQVDQLVYHPETDAFTDARGNDAEKTVSRLVSGIDQRAFGLGRSTLARAALTRQALEGNLEAPAAFASPVLYSMRAPFEMEADAVREEHEGKSTWMKAPNGKPTRLTEQQWIQVRTASFKRWFGDWEKFAGMDGGVWADMTGEVSKVVDDNGEPLVVYHGTDKGGFMSFKEPGGRGRGDLGIFATDDRSMARSYVRKGRGDDITPPQLAPTIEALDAFGFSFDPIEDGGLEVFNRDGYRLGRFATEQEAIDAAMEEAREIDFAGEQAGVYALFMNLRNPHEDDFDGAMWSGERDQPIYALLDADGNQTGEYAYTAEDADRAVKEGRAAEAVPESDLGKTTDDVVREARDYNDGAIIRRVIDDGGGPGYFLDPANVFVAFKPDQVKSAHWNSGEFSQDSDDIRYSMRSAGWSDDRIQDLVDEFGYTDGRTKAYAAMVNPGDFVRATTYSGEHERQIRAESGDLDQERLRNSGTPFIKWDADNQQVIGHEGRHRMVALANAGIDEVPVVVMVASKEGYLRPGAYQPRESLVIDGQKFELGRGQPLRLKGLLPLSYLYQKQIKQEYGRGNVRFSRQEPDFQDIADRVEVSTTVPTAKKNKQLVSDAVTAKWIIDARDVLENDGHRAAAEAAIRSYNAVDLVDKPDAIRALHDTAVDNLVWLHDLMPPRLRERAKLWYDGAHRIARGFAQRYGVDERQAAGVLAVLSPQKDWFMNASLGERVMEIVQRHSDEAWSPAMTAWVRSYVAASKTVAERAKREPLLQLAERLQGVRLRQMDTADAAKFVRVFDETYFPRSYRVVTPEGGFGEFVTNASDVVDEEADEAMPGSVAWGSYPTIEKAVAILRERDPAQMFRTISDALGGEHKVRNFYNNIVRPGSADGHVTIDTHAVAAALVKALSGGSIEVMHNFGTSRKGVSGAGANAASGASGLYGVYADAYRDAAARLGILPRELQSITWEAIRSIYTAPFKARNSGQVEAIFNRYMAGQITREQARDEAVKLAGGIKAMPWEATPQGRFVQEGGSSFDGQIARNPQERATRTLEAVDARDRIQIGLTVATDSNQLPGIAALYGLAKKGDAYAHTLLQDMTFDALKHLLSGTSAKIQRVPVTGLFGGQVEPSLGVTVVFGDSDRNQVLAAIAKFAENFNQKEVHVRQATTAPAGTSFDDGSYVTPVYRWELNRALDRKDVQRAIKKSGLYGLSFGEDFVEAYYVGEPSNEQQRKQFDDAIAAADRVLGQATSGLGRTTARLWTYGDGQNGTIGYERIRGDVSAQPALYSETARRVAAYLNAVDGKPGKVKSFDQPAGEISPKQRALQQRIAEIYDSLPDSDLKNPRVRRAYEQLALEVRRQFKALPVKVEAMVGNGEPYANSDAMRQDILDNNHLFIFATTPETFGPEGADFTGHPLLVDSGFKDANGYPLVFNDLLRAVHDYYAHAMSPTQFGPKGEEAAWKNHMAMTRNMWARWALTAETRGQNSWVNFRADLDPATPIKDRPFARQKAVLLPVEFSLTGNKDVDAPMRAFIDKLPEAQRIGTKPAKDKAKFSEREVDDLGLYSELADQVSKASMAQAPAAAWKTFIRALTQKGVKQDEIEWSGVNDWLDMQQGKVPKQAVVQYLRNNGVQVQQVTLGQSAEQEAFVRQLQDAPDQELIERAEEEGVDFDEVDATDRAAVINAIVQAYEDDLGFPGADGSGAKYERYTLPGGRNYREVLLTLPAKSWWAQPMGGERREFSDNLAASQYAGAFGQAGPIEGADAFISAHWNVDNVLAHLRLTDRQDAQGRKVLFVEEVQSDWGQAGKRRGFGQKYVTEFALRDAQGDTQLYLNDRQQAEAAARQRGLVIEEMQVPLAMDVPYGPFVTKTDGWLNLALKRVLALAVQGGYEAVGFVTGDQSAARYDLSKKVSLLRWRKAKSGYSFEAVGNGEVIAKKDGLDQAALEEHLGKEIAQKIVDGQGADQVSGYDEMMFGKGNAGVLSGLDLKAGGEGMKTFYDRIVPNAVKALLKKFGGTPHAVDLMKDSARHYDAGMMRHDFERQGEEFFRAKYAHDQQPGFLVDERLRETVDKGLPRFSMKEDGPKLEAWMRDVVAGRSRDPGFVLAEQPHPALQMFGVGRSAPVVITADMVRHLVNRKRAMSEITPETVARLPELLKSPRAVVQLMREGKPSYEMILDERNGGGAPLLVILKNETLTMGRQSLKVTDLRTMYHKDNSLWYLLKFIHDGARVWMPEKEIARVRDFTDEGLIPYGTKGAVPPRTSEEAPRSRKDGFKVSQATPNSVFGDAALVKYQAGGNDWRALAEPVRVSANDLRRAQGAAFSMRADWDTPEASRFDDMVYKMQDKHIDTKRVVEAIEAAGRPVDDDTNPYLQEELFHGRTAKRVQDFANEELRPMMEAIEAAGLTMEDVEEFLHARHAKEANAVIAQRNPGEPGLQDGGSGMTNAAADAYMASLDPATRAKLEAVAAQVDAIIAGTRQAFVDYGLEDQGKVDGWAQLFQHYVPLQREQDSDAPTMGIGQGFSVKGKEVKGRTGSTRKVVDILANIALQRERVIVRGEKNRVAQALVGLAAANPNDDFWEVRSQAPTERVYDPKTNTVVDRPDPMFKQRPNVVVAKVKDSQGNVTEQAVVFNEHNARAMRMAQAVKNLDAASLEGLLGVSAKITRYFAAVNTQYNPVFGVVNLVRDVQGALVNLDGTPLKSRKGRIARDTLSALAGIYRDLRAVRAGGQASSNWSQLWEQFQKAGGQTGYRDMFATSQDRADALKAMVDPNAWMDSKLGKIFTANGALRVPFEKAQQMAGGLFNWLSDYNESMENGVRLATFKAALDQGMSVEQAASLAKNLTVNFNRKGQVAQQAGAVYAFFNAAMQGSARIGQTLFTMDRGNVKTLRLSKTGKKVVYGGMLLGTMQALALAAAGFGDDEPPEFVRERSLIIPVGGKTYVTIPMPLGLHVIPGLGRNLTEFALSGFKDPAKRAIGIVGMFADAFNPIGNAGLSMQTLAPTALDPLVALTENKDWTGKPIARTSSNKALPGRTQYKDTASTLAKLLSEAINGVTGGNAYVAGAISPTPDQIDYLLGQVTGGVGREANKIEQSALALARGEELPTYKIPLFGRFVGSSAGQAAEGNAFYANVNRLNEIETEVKGLRKDGKFQEAAAVLRASPESILINQANVAERQIQRLKREKRELLDKGAERDQVRTKEAQITEAMSRLNRAMERYQGASR